MKTLAIWMSAVMITGVAVAKLPAPTDEAKAKAAEAKAKTAWTDKVDAYKLCLAQDKVTAGYMKAKGADAKPVTATIPPCQDPGPYVSAQSSAGAVAAAVQPAATAPVKK